MQETLMLDSETTGKVLMRSFFLEMISEVQRLQDEADLKKEINASIYIKEKASNSFFKKADKKFLDSRNSLYKRKKIGTSADGLTKFTAAKGNTQFFFKNRAVQTRFQFTEEWSNANGKEYFLPEIDFDLNDDLEDFYTCSDIEVNWEEELKDFQQRELMKINPFINEGRSFHSIYFKK